MRAHPRVALPLILLVLSCAGRAQTSVMPSGVIAGAPSVNVQAASLSGTGAPSAACNATTNLNNGYLQTDAVAGNWHWMCAYNSTSAAYGWVQLFSPLGIGATGKLTAGNLAAGACQAVTATVTGAVAGTNTASAQPLGLETASAATAAVLTVKAYVLSANTVSVYVCNESAVTAATVVAVAYKVQVW